LGGLSKFDGKPSVVWIAPHAGQSMTLWRFSKADMNIGDFASAVMGGKPSLIQAARMTPVCHEQTSHATRTDED
jgi:hypothetical protein